MTSTSRRPNRRRCSAGRRLPALAYAHAQNVLHRDIKPANLIVDDRLQLWVTDFGVAKAIESEAVTRTGDVVGTLRYMAPEQIVGDSDVRSDIYSLGVTLYELLAGRPAMDDASIREALVARRPAPSPPRLRQLNPEVPRDLETILHTAMSVDANARYQTADDLAEDLQRFLDRRTDFRASLVHHGTRHTLGETQSGRGWPLGSLVPVTGRRGRHLDNRICPSAIVAGP